jgi:hypothetical protein
MRAHGIIAGGLAILFLGLAFSEAQDRPAPVVQAAVTVEDKLSPAQQQLLLTARRGADWLARMHDPKGRFLPGYLPALQRASEGDNLVRQAAAAAGLARASRSLKEEGYAVRAAQTILTLLEDTVVDPTDKNARLIDTPGDAVTRAVMAAALILAIHELPNPPSDLVEKAEQMCNTLRKLPSTEGKLGEADPTSAGMVLWALAKSHVRTPAAWKPVVVAKSLAYYRSQWEKNRQLQAVRPLTAACVELHLATKDKTAATFAFEIQDWVTGLQYTKLDGRRLGWYGGFMSWQDGRLVESEPDAGTGALAAGLADAMRLTREVGDVQRHQNYAAALEQAVQFLGSLQYTEAGTQHFAVWYRPKVVGGFHQSLSNGDLRIDHTADALAAVMGFAEHLAR